MHWTIHRCVCMLIPVDSHVICTFWLLIQFPRLIVQYFSNNSKWQCSVQSSAYFARHNRMACESIHVNFALFHLVDHQHKWPECVVNLAMPFSEYQFPNHRIWHCIPKIHENRFVNEFSYAFTFNIQCLNDAVSGMTWSCGHFQWNLANFLRTNCEIHKCGIITFECDLFRAIDQFLIPQVIFWRHCFIDKFKFIIFTIHLYFSIDTHFVVIEYRAWNFNHFTALHRIRKVQWDKELLLNAQLFGNFCDGQSIWIDIWIRYHSNQTLWRLLPISWFFLAPQQRMWMLGMRNVTIVRFQPLCLSHSCKK